MRRSTRFVIAILAAGVAMVGCATILGIDDGTPRDAAIADAGDGAFDALDDANDVLDASDAGIAMCDTDAQFQAPIAFATLNTTATDAHGRLSPDERTIYFQSARDGGLGSGDIYSATRTSIGDTWTGVTNIAAVNSTSAEGDPSVTADELAMYFTRTQNLYRSTRTTPTSTFGAPIALAQLNTLENDFAPLILSDGSWLYFSSARNSDAGVSEMFVTQSMSDGGFGAVALVNGTKLTTDDNRSAAVTDDQLVLYFATNRTTGTDYDIWIATRASTAVAFGTPRVVAELSGTSNESPDWISADRCRLYFTSDRAPAGDDDLYVATKLP